MKSCAEELKRMFDHVSIFYQYVDLMAHLPVQAEALRWMVVVTDGFILYCGDVVTIQQFVPHFWVNRHRKWVYQTSVACLISA